MIKPSQNRFLLSMMLVGLMTYMASLAMAKTNLTCTIVDETDKPIAKQEFTLTSDKGKESKKKTNDKGELKFGGLDDGTYSLSGEVVGYVAGKWPVDIAGNGEKSGKYTLVSAGYANAKLQEVMQLIQGKKLADAETLAKKLVETMPTEASAHYVLSVVYAYEGNDQAGAEVKKAAELNPKSYSDKLLPIQMQGLNQQAEAAKQKKDFATALKKYEEMSALSPNEPTVYYNMAVAYAASGDIAKALGSIEKSIALKPDDAEAKQLHDNLQKRFDAELNKKLK